MLIERELFGRLGGFDPRYFMYGEDVDLGLRARAAGARPIYHPAASVLHANGASSTGTAKRVMVLRAKSTLARVHWSRRRARTAVALLHCGVASRALGSALLRRGDRSWVEAWRQRNVWSPGWPPAGAGQSGGGRSGGGQSGGGQSGGGASANAASVRSA